MNNRDMNIDNRDPKENEVPFFKAYHKGHELNSINLKVELDQSKIYKVDTNYNTNKGQKGFLRVNENELNNEMLSFAVTKDVKKAFKEYCKKKKVSQSIVLRELLRALVIDNEQI
jgi:hypothetical protein